MWNWGKSKQSETKQKESENKAVLDTIPLNKVELEAIPMKIEMSPLKIFKCTAEQLNHVIKTIEAARDRLNTMEVLPDPTQWKIASQDALKRAEHANKLASIMKKCSSQTGYLEVIKQCLKSYTDKGYFTAIVYFNGTHLGIIGKERYRMYNSHNGYVDMAGYYKGLADNLNLYLVLLKITKQGYKLSYNSYQNTVYISIDDTQPDCIQVASENMKNYNDRKDIKLLFADMKSNAQKLLEEYPEFISPEDKANYFDYLYYTIENE